MSILERLFGKKEEKKEEIPILEPVEDAEPLRLIPDETYEVIQQAIDAITDYIVRESQKIASKEGHPMEIYPENVIEVINRDNIKIQIHRDSESNPS